VKKKILLLITFFSGYTLLVLLLFYPLVFQSNVLIAPDSLIPQASTMALDKLQAETGTYPLWQPWLFSGMPTVEAFSYLSGLYYPNVFFNLFHTDGIVLQLLHLAFAGLGVFLFLHGYRLTTFAAVFGGAIFMLNPYMSAMLVHGHGSQLMTAAYMPWMLWGTMRLMQRGGLADAGILALIAGFQLQRSHVQIAYYSWMLLLLFVLFFFFSLRDVPSINGLTKGSKSLNTVRCLSLLLVALGCGVAMSASIYLPASEYAAFSVRGMAAQGGASSWEYATLWSLHPLELFTFIVPGSFGFGGVTYWGFMPFTDFPNYAGIVVLLLAVSGIVMRLKEPIIWFALTATLLALLLSFGRFFSPVFDLFYHFAPLFSRFRVPSMALIMLYLMVSFLAAIGMHDLLHRQSAKLPKPAKLLKLLKIGALFIAVILIFSLLFEEPVESFFHLLFPDPSVESFDLAFMVNKLRWEQLIHSLWIVLLLAAFFAGVLWLYMTKKLSLIVSAGLLMLLALGDLLWIDMQIIYPSADALRSPLYADRHKVEQAFQPDAITRYLAAQKKPFRVYPAGTLFAENKFALFGIESVGGYHPAKLKIYEEFLAKTENLSSINALRMLNVGYIVSPMLLNHPALELATTGTLQLVSGPITAHVYRLQGSAPRAWFASRVTGAQGSRTFAEATVTSLEAKAEAMDIKVATSGEAFLVVSELYYPLRWKVKIDGHDASMVKVNGLMRGVVVPSGSREVRFYYDRSSFDVGRNISLAAFVVALLMVGGGVSWSLLIKSGESRIPRGYH